MLGTGVVSNGEHLEADVVVLAAALGIPDLSKPLGLSVPLTAKPRTVTLITKPLKPLLRHIVVTGELQNLLLILRRVMVEALKVSVVSVQCFVKPACSGLTIALHCSRYEASWNVLLGKML